jgi:hypothetical protein
MGVFLTEKRVAAFIDKWGRRERGRDSERKTG